MKKVSFIPIILEVVLVLFVGIFLPEHVVMAKSIVSDATSLKDLIINTINGVFVPVIFSTAFIVFLWGIFKYFIAGATDPEGQRKGKQLIFYGIVGFAIMVSVWGLVNILVNTFGLAGTTKPAYPKL